MANATQPFPQSGAGVPLNPDGSLLKSPFHENAFIIVFQIALCFVGVPMNGLSAIAVVRLEELRKQPRHVFFIAIQMCNLMAYFVSLLEIIVYLSFPKTSPNYDSVCQVYVAIVGLPQLLLLVASFLSIVDRFLAIRSPLWHRAKVTARLVSIELFIGFFLTVFVNKFMFIFHLVPLSCRIIPIERIVMGWFLWIIFGLCLFGRIVIYLQTRQLIHISTKTAQPRATKNPKSKKNNKQGRLPATITNRQSSTNRQQPSCSISKNKNPRNMAAILLNRPSYSRIVSSPERTNRMKAECRRNLASGLTVLILLNCPLMILSISMSICRNWFCPTDYPIRVCNRFGWLVNYFKQLSQINGLYHPIMCWICDSDIREAVKFIGSSKNKFKNRYIHI